MVPYKTDRMWNQSEQVHERLITLSTVFHYDKSRTVSQRRNSPAFVICNDLMLVYSKELVYLLIDNTGENGHSHREKDTTCFLYKNRVRMYIDKAICWEKQGMEGIG